MSAVDTFTNPQRDDWATIFALLTDVRVHTTKCSLNSTIVNGYVTTRDGAQISIQAELAPFRKLKRP